MYTDGGDMHHIAVWSKTENMYRLYLLLLLFSFSFPFFFLSLSCFWIDFMAQEQILTYKQIFIILLRSSSFFFCLSLFVYLHVSRSRHLCTVLLCQWKQFFFFFGLCNERIILGETHEIYWARHVCDGDMMNKTDKTSQRNERLRGGRGDERGTKKEHENKNGDVPATQKCVYMITE